MGTRTYAASTVSAATGSCACAPTSRSALDSPNPAWLGALFSGLNGGPPVLEKQRGMAQQTDLLVKVKAVACRRRKTADPPCQRDQCAARRPAHRR